MLSASKQDNKIAWYRNHEGGYFSEQHVITSEALGARSVWAADVDGDGKVDVLSASEDDTTVAWYQNLGNGSFGGKQVITNEAKGANIVLAADVDNDDKTDIVSASSQDGIVRLYGNLGDGSFTHRLITKKAFQPSGLSSRNYLVNCFTMFWLSMDDMAFIETVHSPCVTYL